VGLRHEGGYGLVEAVATMAILGTVLGGITSLFVSGSRAQVEMNQRFQAQSQARVALDRIRRDVHCSSVGQAADATTVTLTMPTGCIASGSVTWCTVSVGGSTTRYQLRRLTGVGTCSTDGSLLADHLVTGSVFTYQPQSLSSLAKLRADIQVKLDQMKTRYRLCDVLVLRNSARTGSSSTTAPPC
jgi:hypothetical protein